MVLKELAVILALLAIPTFLGYYATFVATMAIIFASYTLPWLYMEKEAGWLSLGNSIAFGLAAYSLAIDARLLPLSIAVSVGMVFALSFAGRPLFPFATFVCSLAFWQASHHIVIGGSGGEEGFSYASLPLNLAFLSAAVLFLSGYLLFRALSSSSFGLKVNATRDDEIAARSVGINPVSVRLAVFAISITFSALSGVIYLLYFGHVSPDVFSPVVALFPFIASILAGKRWISPLIGSYLIVAATNALAAILPGFHYLIYAAALAAFPLLRRVRDAAETV